MTAAKLKPGDTLDGKYTIDRVLGDGGMGVVYGGMHTKLDQAVAIKVMLPEMLAHPTLVARFEREARAAARIKSRHVPRVFDVDVTAEGLPYIVMELLSGRDLASVLEERGPLEPQEAVDYVLQACVAIREAHAREIVHRDLKPANLFLASEQGGVMVKVLDFGISKDVGGTASKLTHEHAIIGTVMYMSPEQVRGGTVDGRSDVWALGVVLYELLTGRMPFEGSVTQASAAIVADEPAPMARPAISAALEEVIRGALQKKAERRYQTVTALMEALASFATPAVASAALAEVPEREPSLPSVPSVDATATTLNASDRIRAPRIATADGLSTETVHSTTKRRTREATLGVLVGALVVGGGAFALMSGSPPPAEVPAPSASASASGPEKALAAAPPATLTPEPVVDAAASPPAKTETPIAEPPTRSVPKRGPRPRASVQTPGPTPVPVTPPVRPTRPPDHL